MKKLSSLIFIIIIALSYGGCGKKEITEWEKEYNIGLKFVSQANYEEAVVAFTKALTIDPKQANVYVSLAEVYINQGDFFTAQTTLDKALTEAGQTDRLSQAMAKLKQAQLPDFPSEPPVAVRRERGEYNDEYYHMYSYDKNDNIIRAEVYKVKDNVMESDELYFFDSNNNRIRVYNYTPDGELVRYTICNYYEKNRTGYDYYYGGDTQLDSFVIYTLNEDGGLNTWKQYYPTGELMRER